VQQITLNQPVSRQGPTGTLSRGIHLPEWPVDFGNTLVPKLGDRSLNRRWQERIIRVEKDNHVSVARFDTRVER
jgi:hypothetical protein